MNKIDLLKKLNTVKTRSAWDKGVLDYALEIVENYAPEEVTSVDDVLNYARDKHESLYSVAKWQSEGGCFEIYDEDIAKRLCTPSELRRCTHKDGRLRDMANARESWLDVQSRAVNQAYRLINSMLHRIELY